MSSRASSSPLCAPVCHTWFPSTRRAAPRRMCVAVWCLRSRWRRSPAISHVTRFPTGGVGGGALEEVDDGAADLLHVDDVVPADRPAVRLLPPALRVEERLVEDDAVPLDREDLGGELPLVHVLVYAEPARRGVPPPHRGLRAPRPPAPL